MGEGIRIGVQASTDDIQPCAHLSPPCPDPGYVPEATIVVLSLLLKETIKTEDFRLIGANGYGLTGGFEHNDSILRQVLSGWIDSSPVDTTMTVIREDALESVGPLLPTQPSFVYRTPPLSQPNIDSVLTNSWPSYAILLGAALCVYLAKYILAKYLSSKWQESFSRFLGRNKVLFGLFVGIFLRYFSSIIVILFNLMEPATGKFGSTWEILGAVTEGKLTVVSRDNLFLYSYIYNFADRGTSQRQDRLLDSYSFNPPVKVPNFLEGLDLVLNGTGDGREFVYVGEYEQGLYFLSTHCGITSFSDPTQLPTWHTIYVRKNLTMRKVDGRLRKVIAEEVRKVRDKYFKPLDCNAPTIFPSKESAPLSAQNILGLFSILGILSSAGLGILGMEMLYPTIEKRSRKNSRHAVSVAYPRNQ